MIKTTKRMVTTDDKIEYAQVLYDYDAKFADELTTRSGDLVQVKDFFIFVEYVCDKISC